jgi:hypothetical protein
MAVDRGTAGICEKTVTARENLIWGKPSVFFNNRRFSKPSVLVPKQKEIQIFQSD